MVAMDWALSSACFKGVLMSGLGAPERTATPSPRVAALWDPTTGTSPVSTTENAARALKLKLQVLEIRRADDLVGAFAAARNGQAEALNVFSSPDLAPIMTSSARASSVGGTSRPSALAVLRLTTNSYLVGACTGRSAGFSPLRMRSIYPAARPNGSMASTPYAMRLPSATK